MHTRQITTLTGKKRAERESSQQQQHRSGSMWSDLLGHVDDGLDCGLREMHFFLPYYSTPSLHTTYCILYHSIPLWPLRCTPNEALSAVRPH